MTNKYRTTLKIIAGSANVSVTTASRVLSGKGKEYRISQTTQDTIRRIAEDLEYEPDHLARSLRMNQTNTIGLIIPEITSSFFSSVARRIEIASRKSGYSVTICDSQEDTVLEIDSIKLLSMRKVDGIIICPVGRESKHIDDLNRVNIPVITVDRYFPDLDIAFVVSDNHSGSVQAVDHFIKNGHRKIAFVQGNPYSSVNKERLRGFRDAHKKHNLPIDESLIVGDSFGEQNGYSGAKILLSGSNRPTAIFAGSNLISLGAMRAISEEGLNIPEDISMISFDDQPYSDFLCTPMTTVTQQHEEIGDIAIKLLLKEITSENKTDKKGIIIPTKLIIRKSVKRLN